MINIEIHFSPFLLGIYIYYNTSRLRITHFKYFFSFILLLRLHFHYNTLLFYIVMQVRPAQYTASVWTMDQIRSWKSHRSSQCLVQQQDHHPTSIIQLAQINGQSHSLILVCQTMSPLWLANLLIWLVVYGISEIIR